MLVDAGAVQGIRRRRRQQHVVDADTVVLLPRPGLVVPERILLGQRVAGVDRVDQAQIDEAPIGRPRFRPEQGIAFPGNRIVAILRPRNVAMKIDVPYIYTTRFVPKR